MEERERERKYGLLMVTVVCEGFLVPYYTTAYGARIEMMREKVVSLLKAEWKVTAGSHAK